MKCAQTWHTSLMKRGEGKEWRVDCCSILQQQLHTLQATSCTGVTQRRASINVTSFHLGVTKAWFSQKKTNRWNRIFVVLALFCAELTESYLCTSIQQQPDTLGLSTYARLVQRGDGVHRHDVYGCAPLDQLLQLEDPALCSSLMHCWPVCPEAKTMGWRNVRPSLTVTWWFIMTI